MSDHPYSSRISSVWHLKEGRKEGRGKEREGGREREKEKRLFKLEGMPEETQDPRFQEGIKSIQKSKLLSKYKMLFKLPYLPE